MSKLAWCPYSREMSETRSINLPAGGTLELTIEPGFYDAVRQRFSLAPDQQVDDDHLRMFVFGAFKAAIDKAEGEMLRGKEDDVVI